MGTDNARNSPPSGGDRVPDAAGGDGPEQGEAGNPGLPGGDGAGDPGAAKIILLNSLVFIHK